MASSNPRRRGSAYPLWIGLGSLIGLSLLWAFRPTPDAPTAPQAASDALASNAPGTKTPAGAAPASNTPAGAAPASNAPNSAASVASAPQAIPELRWIIEGGPALSGQALGDCLRTAGWQRLTAHGGGTHPVSVTHGALVLPSLITTRDGHLEVRTRLPARRHQSVALHTAIAGCLKGERLRDPHLGVLANAERWPSPRRDAGLRAELLMRIAPQSADLTLEGLGRLGLKDLIWTSADSPAARRQLLHAGALLLLQDDPGATTLPFRTTEVHLTPQDTPGLIAAHRIDLPPPPAPAATPSRRAVPKRRPKPAKPRPRPKATRPAPTAPRRPTPATPRWRPDYVD